MTTSSTQQNQTSSKPEWTEPEKWVWEQVCKGEIADFNFKLGKDLDSRKEEGWNEERLISPKFLETVLFEDTYCNKLHRQGVRIYGAWIKEKLDLSNASINIELQLIKSRFEDYVNMTLLQCRNTISFEGSSFKSSLIFSYAKIESYLNLIGVKVEGELDMNTLSVGSSLFMREGSEFNSIMMRSAKVGGHLDLSKAKVTGALDMDSISVGSGLVMRDEAELNDVILTGAKIQGYVDFCGAKFTGTLNMNSVSIGSSLFMKDGAEFNNINLIGARIEGQLNLNKAKVKGEINMNSLTVHSHLFMEEGAEFKDVILRSSKIFGVVSLIGAKVSNKLDMDSISVGSSLFMRDGAEFNNVNLINAKVEGQLNLNKAKVTGDLNMNSISIGSHLFLGEGAEFNKVDLIGAQIKGVISIIGTKSVGIIDMSSILCGSLYMRNDVQFQEIKLIGARIEGQLDMSDIIVKDKIYMESIVVEKNVFLRAKKYEGYFSFILSRVNGSVYISDAEISRLDLGGTNIRGELHIGSSGQKIKWQQGSFMNLRNTEAGAIMDAGKDSWPEELNLDGFTYSRLGGLFGYDTPESKQIAERDSKWFVEWLKKDKDYSPQPYNQLAEILNKMGYPEKANSVLYAGKNRELREAKQIRNWGKWFGLSLLKWTVGFGFGGRYFRSLIWVLCLTILGVIVLGTLNNSSVPNIWDKIGFSIDMLLPIISLDGRYKLDFYGWQLYYFYFHELMGFLLGSFVLAGLSGITKK